MQQADVTRRPTRGRDGRVLVHVVGLAEKDKGAMVSRLFRPISERMIGGVCSGLGLYFGLDPVIVRLLFVVIAATTGLTLILYPILWAIMPSGTVVPPPPVARFDPQTGLPLMPQNSLAAAEGEPDASLPPPAARSRNRILALVLVGVGLLILLDNIGVLIGFNLSGVLVPLLLIGLGIYLLRGSREHGTGGRTGN